jgi:hypothetical protein
MDLFEENSGLIMLQLLIILLAAVILILLYFERSVTSNISQKVNDFKCPSCPDCPTHPPCPACNCTNDERCPDCVCPENSECPTCPELPEVKTSCPKQDSITVNEIVDAIFPGRNSGLTTHGQYFPLDGLGEGSVEPAYSPVISMMPNYNSVGGVPSAISFSDQTVLNKSSIGLASQKAPPLSTTQGVFSQRGTGDIATDIMTAQKLNGDSLNGDSLNGVSLNGDSLNGDSLNGDSLNGDSLNGDSLNGETMASGS